MSTDTPAVLRARGLRVEFGTTVALDDLDLSMSGHRIQVLLGPNGAGKTTLLRCLTGLLDPTSGQVELFGRSPARALAAGRVGVMPQRTAAWSGIRPVELLRYLADLHAHPLPVDDLAAELGIDDFARTPYRRLSGGQQQALNLAGAIIGRPELVLLDEPTAGMDVHLRRRVFGLIRQLRDSGVSVLLTTHDMDEAARLADRITIIDRGRVSAEGTLAELTGGSGDLEEVFVSLTTPGGVG
ncbi:ABC transporter ATP-binding protein [Naumannella halotolerans]|uniref:ABC-2 type transport system ATP-binding protein n=1 Tax=Naumannella halotolerans TaxID=993414 RepID=A0A4R7J661_9ACTN|nr:ABC transporter ATP-binding protein [Naumannella halotolerans]TDT32862.1 ABC-2 type transport system ATP-binding protein [Naumannella halotolerans]